MDTTAPAHPLTVGDRFEHPTHADPFWFPSGGETDADRPAQLCQVVAVHDEVIDFKDVVAGSLWGLRSAPASELAHAKRSPRG